MALSDSTERKLLWDEENRLGAININGFISGYWYDAAGERVIKSSGDDEGMYVNDVFSGARTMTDNFTAYINPYLVVSKGGQYTKHIYIGSQRIVSKLGDLDSYGQDPRRVEYAGSNVEGAKIDYATKYKQSQQTIKDNYAHFEVEYNGIDNDDYVNGGGFCCDDKPMTKSFVPQENDNPELFQYYYHSDHLGSSSLITNLDGEVVQHIEYVPFGEVFIEERNNKWNTPYLFNAKELDEETGLYYYGARYYDPRSNVWLSTDPLQEKYPHVSTYAYCLVSPIKYFDPTGEGPWDDLVAWGNRNNVGTRVVGGLQMVGGVVEAVAGGVGGVVTAETGVGAVIGYAVLINGIDNTVAGAKQMWTGESERTLLNTGLYEGSKALGADEATANDIANYGEFAGTLGLNIWNARNIIGLNNTLGKSSLPNISAKTLSAQPNGFTYSHTLQDGKVIFNNSMSNNGRFDFIIKNGEVLIGEGHYYMSNYSKTVNGAGTITLKGGKISNISNWSGHYQPTMKELDQTIDFLKSSGYEFTKDFHKSVPFQ